MISYLKVKLKQLFPKKKIQKEPQKRILEKKKGERVQRAPEKNIYPWLGHDASSDVMYCKVCRNYPKLVDITSPLYRSTGGNGKYRLETLKSHNGSGTHLKCVNSSQMDQGEADEPLPKQFTAAFSKSDQETKARLHNTAFYIARENLTFSKFKGQCNLQEKNGRDFGNQYKNDKASRDFGKHHRC